MTDDKCANVIYVSGDKNKDSKLGIGGTWKYSCTTHLTQTTTNIVTATGYADFATAVDTAEATVVVGSSLVPPLIRIVKTPNVFTLPSTGGVVTYLYTITNPGTEPLNNVGVNDDKCTGLPSRITGHPGDINKNDLLEPSETWSFTCKSYLTKTTTNKATATGHANGLTAKDTAFATVVVPQALGVTAGFPNTGLAPKEESFPWNTVIFVLTMLAIAGMIPAKKERGF